MLGIVTHCCVAMRAVFLTNPGASVDDGAKVLAHPGSQLRGGDWVY